VAVVEGVPLILGAAACARGVTRKEIKTSAIAQIERARSATV